MRIIEIKEDKATHFVDNLNCIADKAKELIEVLEDNMYNERNRYRDDERIYGRDRMNYRDHDDRDYVNYRRGRY